MASVQMVDSVFKKEAGALAEAIEDTPAEELLRVTAHWAGMAGHWASANVVTSFATEGGGGKEYTGPAITFVLNRTNASKPQGAGSEARASTGVVTQAKPIKAITS